MMKTINKRGKERIREKKEFADRVIEIGKIEKGKETRKNK